MPTVNYSVFTASNLGRLLAEIADTELQSLTCDLPWSPHGRQVSLFMLFILSRIGVIYCGWFRFDSIRVYRLRWFRSDNRPFSTYGHTSVWTGLLGLCRLAYSCSASRTSQLMGSFFDECGLLELVCFMHPWNKVPPPSVVMGSKITVCILHWTSYLMCITLHSILSALNLSSQTEFHHMWF